MRRRCVGGGAGKAVGGDGEFVLDPAQRLLQFEEAGVQSGQPFVDEVGQLQPRVDRGAAVRVVAPAGRRHRVKGLDLLDQAQLPVPAGPRRRGGVVQPLDLAPQLVRGARAERFGFGLHPGLGDAHPGSAQDACPQ